MSDREETLSDWKIWCEHQDEAAAMIFTTDTAIGVVLLYLDSAMVAAAGDELAEDYFVKRATPRSPIKRFRVELAKDAAGIIIQALRTCRMCGCTDDRACEHGCSWVGPDKCSECFP